MRQREPESVTNQLADGSGQFEIIGQSATLLRVLQELDVVAASDLPVLLLGETGTGKEFLARHIHKFSAGRSKKDFPGESLTGKRSDDDRMRGGLKPLPALNIGLPFLIDVEILPEKIDCRGWRLDRFFLQL